MRKSSHGIKDEILLNTIMNHSDDMICFKNRESKIIAASKAYALLRGEKSCKEIIGKTDFDYFPQEVAMKILKDELTIINTGISKKGVIKRVIKADGSPVWLSSSKHPLYDKEKNIIGTWGVFQDISSLKEAEQEFIKLNKKLEDANNELKNLSSKDSLSGLYNQGHFFEELKEKFELNKRRSEKTQVKGFTLMIIDVDDFKDINDIYGHLMGDSTIRHISKLIRENVRISDLCFRYGGDEFAIILADTSLEEAKIVAEKLRKTINKNPVKFMEKKVILTISIGISSFNEAMDENKMIKIADERLYNSKRNGKNRIS